MIKTTIKEMARKGIIVSRESPEMRRERVTCAYSRPEAADIYDVADGWLVIHNDRRVSSIDATEELCIVTRTFDYYQEHYVSDVFEVSIYRELTGESMV